MIEIVRKSVDFGRVKGGLKLKIMPRLRRIDETIVVR